MRVAVVGLGKIAQLKYLPALRAHPGAELAALVDRSEELLGTVSDRFGVDASRRFRALEAVPQEAADAVLVLTHDHYDLLETASDRGWHALVEKPVCHTAAGARRLRDRARAAGTLLLCAYMRRLDPHVELLRERVAELGPPLLVRSLNLAGGVKRWTDPISAVARAPAADREAAGEELRQMWQRLGEAQQWAQAAARAAPVLLQLGIHDLDLLDFVLGPGAQVTSARADGTAPAVSLGLRAADSVPVSLHVAPLFAAPWKWRQELEVTYPDRILRLEFGNPFLPTNETRLVELSEPTGEPSVVAQSLVDPFGLLVDHAVERLAAGAPDASDEAAIRDLDLIEDALALIGGRQRAVPREESA